MSSSLPERTRMLLFHWCGTHRSPSPALFLRPVKTYIERDMKPTTPTCVLRRRLVELFVLLVTPSSLQRGGWAKLSEVGKKGKTISFSSTLLSLSLFSALLSPLSSVAYLSVGIVFTRKVRRNTPRGSRLRPPPRTAGGWIAIGMVVT